MSRIAVVALIAVLGFDGVARADSWPNATVKAYASENGEVVARIIPGSSISDTVGFAGAPKGSYATAMLFRFRDDQYALLRTIELANPVAPLQAAVANDGTLATLDNWHNVGYGFVVVIYGPDGSLRKRHRLADLYTAAQLDRMSRSVSSIWWRCLNREPAIDRASKMRIDDMLGGRFTFHVATGAHTYAPGAGECGRP